MNIKRNFAVGLAGAAVCGVVAFVLGVMLISTSRPEGQLVLSASALTGVGAVAGLVFLAVGCIGLWLMSGRLSAYINCANVYLEQIAQGKFSEDLPDAGTGEFSGFGKQLAATMSILKRRIGFAEGVLNAIADAYPFMTCDENARIDFIGKQFLKVSGKKGHPSEYMGMSIGGYIYGDDTRKTRTDKVVADGIRIEGETRIEGDGITHVLQFSADPIFDLDDNQIGALTIYFDLTEVKQQQQAIEENAKRVAEIASELVGITEQVNSTAEVIASQINEAASGAAFQSERTTETATAMEEMNSTTFEVARNAVSAADNANDTRTTAREGQNEVERLIESIETMRNQANTLSEFMGELGQQTESVGSVINVIQDIADQTNLLALNAAIEAARAGEAGRGFAVVADEVRKLAEKTMTATDEVSAAINAIQNGAKRSIEGVRHASEAVEKSTGIAMNSGKTLERIVELVISTADQVQSIATAAEQQSATSEEIHKAVEDINRIASQTAQGMQEANTASSDLALKCDELNTLIKRLSS
ncbi:methyl-accepting chemotaxis protein [Salidesulfovibrio onnuriiensis]|uniref:methyl-accepting chemotaxis protein n=1 Tax=Salidesulfovibrio onnuriiensis TaxID=2583823 RepID=UPI0016508765|nr:methyl-accepting chemotaxis protein [Salidesulfovibrio onnuriiensis]